MSYPQLSHCGAIASVADSCRLLHLDVERGLLVGCGFFQGAEILPEGRLRVKRIAIDFLLAGIKYLVLTPVHIDQVGRAPCLLVIGFKGVILCGELSARLLTIVLADSYRLGLAPAQQQAECYLKLLELRIIALPYDSWFTLVDCAQLNAAIRTLRAGNILNILCFAYIGIDLHYRQTAASKRVIFFGDLVDLVCAPHSPHSPLLPDSKARADILAIESACGESLHDGLLKLQIVLELPLARHSTQAYRQLELLLGIDALVRVRCRLRIMTVDSNQASLIMVRRLAEIVQPAVGGMCTGWRIAGYFKVVRMTCFSSVARSRARHSGIRLRGWIYGARRRVLQNWRQNEYNSLLFRLH